MKPLRIQVLQHEPFEGPGLVGDWAKENGHSVFITEIFKSEPLPEPDTFDWLVLMGGGMSVNDEDKSAWLKAEKAFILNTIDAGKVVIGFCFGSQMIANVLGAEVYKNYAKEIGWYPVQLTDAGKQSAFVSSKWNKQIFFHWHGETFDLPEGAVHLAFSKECRNQAFNIGDKVFGFQFHPETNEQTLHQMVKSGSDELVKTNFVMEAGEILEKKNFLGTTKPLFLEFLEKVCSQQEKISSHR